MAIPVRSPYGHKSPAATNQAASATTALPDSQSSSEASSAASSATASPVLPMQASASTASQTHHQPAPYGPHEYYPHPQQHPNMAPPQHYSSGSMSVPQSPSAFHSPHPANGQHQQRPAHHHNEHLIQAFCEALYRCSMSSPSPAPTAATNNGVGGNAGAGSGVYSMPPPSPSCTPHTAPAHPAAANTPAPYSSSYPGADSNIFFPQHMVATPLPPPSYHVMQQQPPHTPMQHYYAHQQVPAQASPLYFQYHQRYPQPEMPSTPSNNASHNSQQPMPRLAAARRIRLTSRGEAVESESSEEDQMQNEINNCLTRTEAEIVSISALDGNNNSSASALHDHLHYLEARERLEEFPGRVPLRRKKSKKLQSCGEAVITSQKQQRRQVPDQPSAMGSADKTHSSTTEPSSESSSSDSDSTHDVRQEPSSRPENKEQCFNWPLISAFVLVVGCGFFASR